MIFYLYTEDSICVCSNTALRPSPKSIPNTDIIRDKYYKIKKWSYSYGCEISENLIKNRSTSSNSFLLIS